MASLTYKMNMNKGSGTPDFSKMSVDADGDGHLDDDYVPAAPGIDPGVARASKTPKSTSMDCFRYIVEDKPAKDGRLHNKFMPGYAGYIPTEMNIKTMGGQWSPPKFLEVEAKQVRARSPYVPDILPPAGVTLPSHLVYKPIRVRRPTSRLRTLVPTSRLAPARRHARSSSLATASSSRAGLR